MTWVRKSLVSNFTHISVLNPLLKRKCGGMRIPFADSVLFTSVVPFYGESFQPVLYCSPIICPGPLNKDLTSIKKSVSNSSGVACSHICKTLISQHFNSCKRLSSSIINDPLHPLHLCLAMHCQLLTLDLHLTSSM